jgi:hypothetical protein
MRKVFAALLHIENTAFALRIIKIIKKYDVPFWGHYALTLIYNILHIVEIESN